MEINRRYFLKYVASGTAGITIGVPYFLESCSKNLTGGNFPFFIYAKSYNFGDYIPKDQGGKFIQEEILGTENDEIVVEKIRNGILEKIYGNPIGWGSLEKTELEKSVWLNRFYYLPSFARLYYLNKNKDALEFMVQFIRKWIAENPRDGERKISKYNWYDMQVAWRSIHLSWCYFLAENGLSKDDKKLIIDSLEEHAKLLLSGFGQQKLNEFNHQSHGALAMLYLGSLFPLLTDSQKLVEAALRILSHHIKNAFYNDGGNVEQMFGYYPFEAHIFRDAYLLCKANGIEPPEGITGLLQKMANYLLQVAQPDGTMPPVNDSFPMPVKTILETLKNILNEEEGTKKVTSYYFPDTQIGIIRNNDGDKNGWYAMVNPAITIGSHAHAGRLAFNLWYDGQPVFNDSGCCNYDKPTLVEWYRTSKAHNTVLIDGKSDEATSSSLQWAPKRQTENRITEWIEKPNFTFCRMVSPKTEESNSSVKWTRNLILLKNKYFLIYDNFEAEGHHNYELLFHLTSTQVQINEDSKIFTFNSNGFLSVLPVNPQYIKKLGISEGLVSEEGVNLKKPIISLFLEGDGSIHSVLVIAPDLSDPSDLNFDHVVSEEGLAMQITNKEGEDTVVLFRRDEAQSIHYKGHQTNELIEVY